MPLTLLPAAHNQLVTIISNLFLGLDMPTTFLYPSHTTQSLSSAPMTPSHLKLLLGSNHLDLQLLQEIQGVVEVPNLLPTLRGRGQPRPQP